MTDTMEQFAKHINTLGDPDNPDPLDPELEAYMEEREGGGTMIRHPLVFSVFHAPMLNRVVNKQLEQKRAAIAEYAQEANWSGYMWMHERPYRLWAFSRVERRIKDDAEWWSLLGHIWTDSENIRQSLPEWYEYLSSVRRKNRDAIMDDDDERAWVAKHRERGERLTVYRGFQHEESVNGYSWTVDREKAAWFAQRLWIPEKGGCPQVATGEVHPDKIIAFFNGRAENEVVSMDVDVREIEEIDV